MDSTQQPKMPYFLRYLVSSTLHDLGFRVRHCPECREPLTAEPIWFFCHGCNMPVLSGEDRATNDETPHPS